MRETIVNLSFQFPGRRPAGGIVGFDDGGRERRQSSPCLAILQAVTCHNAFGGGSSKSTTSSDDSRVAATEDAKVLREGSQLTESGAIGVGPGAKFQEAGAADLEGSSGSRVGTTEVTGGSEVTVTTADPDVLKTALQEIGDLSRSQTSQFSAFARETSAQNTDQLKTVLSELDQLTEQKDEAKQTDRTFLYLALAVLALLAVVFFPRKNA